MSAPRAPVIIIGMHRSGTSLLTRALQRFGFFMGIGTSRNEEAAFTNALNNWLFRHAGATWDQPESMNLLLQDHDLRPHLNDYLAGVIDGPASLRFLGPVRWMRDGGLRGIGQPWGWKDPRNTYTLPFWLELFPDARVIHIVRHGVDVAESLRTRRARELGRNLARYRNLRSLYHANPFAPKRRPFAGHQRCARLDGGFSLWEAYVDRAREHVDALGTHALEIEYEKLVAEPANALEQALEFCGIEATPDRIHQAGARMDTGRVFAFRQNQECTEFAASVEGRLRHRGYSSDPAESE